MPRDKVEVLGEGLTWEQFLWAPSGVQVLGKLVEVQRLHFTERTQRVGAS